jgi:N-acetylneuraminate synthase
MSKSSGGVFIIAEAGVNHNGSETLARELVHAAAEAGADAVKFQTFSADRLVLKSAKKADYQVANTRSGDSQYDMLKALELGLDAQIALRALCDERGIEFMSSPFDIESLDFLVQTLRVKRLKIPSGEVINGPLMLRAARSGLPLIVSSGMCSLDEIEESLSLLAWSDANPSAIPPSRAALAEFRGKPDWTATLKKRVWLLQCTTQYPAPPSAINLRAMETLAKATGLVVGFSDHSLGWHLPVASVAAGARVIEKHFTLSRRLPGPDHLASLEPDELARMIREVRDVSAALGTGIKEPDEIELRNRLPARGSIVAVRPIAAGAMFSIDDVTVKRPGNGLSPLALWDLIGRNATRSYAVDDQIGASEIDK